MLKDHQAFTNVTDMVTHYKRVRENLHKNVYVPEPRSEVEEPPPKKKLLPVEKRPTLSIEPKYIEEYERSVKGLVESGNQKKANRVTMRDIVDQVAKKHGFYFKDVMYPCRRKKYVAARYESFYRMRNELDMSFPRIAAFFNMDHTSVLHGVRQHEKRIKKENKNG